MNSRQILTITGIAVVGFFVLKGLGKRIAGNIEMGFEAVKFIDFWKNILKLKIHATPIFYILNKNDILIEVSGFKGTLQFKGEKIADINLDAVVDIPPKNKANIKFDIKANLLESAARLFLALKGKTNAATEGGRIVGTLKGRIDGVPFSMPYDEAVVLEM